jgi:hypothetical protein
MADFEFKDTPNPFMGNLEDPLEGGNLKLGFLILIRLGRERPNGP